MRIIAGEFRSRRLQSMPGTDVRPTSDKMRETLFNIIRDEVENAVFVDAYAGTGAVGIEALSRGARHVVFIEKNRGAANLIRTNLAALKAEARARVIHGPAALYLGGLEADIVFIDPPYPLEREYQASLDTLEAKPPALVIVQHSSRFALDDVKGPLRRTRMVKQGENALSFFRHSL
jgi:16S rRNA (guanine(966)-N(2))-methyltransferase RsmD